MRPNSGKALLGLMLQHEGARTSNMYPCLLHKGGEQAGSLNGVKVGISVGWAWGGLGDLPNSWWCCAGIMRGILFLLWHLRSCSWVFALFVSYFALTVHAHSYF